MSAAAGKASSSGMSADGKAALRKQASAERKSPFGQLLDAVQHRCGQVGLKWTTAMQQDLPKKWEKHGDMVILPTNCFREPQWRSLGPSLWSTIASALQVSRVGRKHKVDDDDYRSPFIDLYYGADGWVEHVDNQVRYQYDVRKCMFSIGNVSEKLRVAAFDCRQEVVVDCFAGIGYFTLQYLVHAGAQHVYAVDWNEDAIEALQRNLQVNGVEDRCTVLEGDCRRMTPVGVADRVNLGLLPTARQYLVYACRALKLTGGRLHVHENVTRHKALALGSGNAKLERADSGISTNEEGSSRADSPSRSAGGCRGSGSTTSSAESGVAEASIDVVDGEGDEEQPPPRKPSAIRLRLQQELDAVRTPRPSLAPHMLEKWSTLDASHRVFAHDCACMVIRFMNNLHELPGSTYTCEIERVGKIKSYAPHMDHVVVDLLLRPTPNHEIDFDAQLTV